MKYRINSSLSIYLWSIDFRPLYLVEFQWFDHSSWPIHCTHHFSISYIVLLLFVNPGLSLIYLGIFFNPLLKCSTLHFVTLGLFLIIIGRQLNKQDSLNRNLLHQSVPSRPCMFRFTESAFALDYVWKCHIWRWVHDLLIWNFPHKNN